MLTEEPKETQRFICIMKIGRFFGMFANCATIILVSISVVWTGLTVVLLSMHGLSDSNLSQISNHQVSIGNSALPKLDGQVLAKQLKSFFLLESNSLSEIDEFLSRFEDTLVALAVILNMQDTTFFIASKSIGECGCPATQTNRYEIKYRYFHPVTLEVLEEKTFNGLSAEAVDETQKNFSF